eukprot:scaffold251124_cov32-Tisochrysis_lutea.AAC.4
MLDCLGRRWPFTFTQQALQLPAARSLARLGAELGSRVGGRWQRRGHCATGRAFTANGPMRRSSPRGPCATWVHRARARARRLALGRAVWPWQRPAAIWDMGRLEQSTKHLITYHVAAASQTNGLHHAGLAAQEQRRRMTVTASSSANALATAFALERAHRLAVTKSKSDCRLP